MKLEVGQFVRFKDKRGIEYIRKITSVNNTYPDKLYAGIYIDKETNNSNGVSLKNIIKASFDIMDLIEVRDYVNGEYIIQVSKTFGLLFIETTYYDEVSGEEKHKFIKKEEIKSIVTKEQFEQMSYKVGE